MSHVPCKRPATIQLPKRAPVCWSHRKFGDMATFCQAMVGKNRKCRKSIALTETQLCVDHADFVLPCYFFRLPTELRLQIYFYVLEIFGGQYVTWKKYVDYVLMMQVNRQFFEEAMEVLHRDMHCTIYISHQNDIIIMGRVCSPIQFGPWQKFRKFRVMFNFHSTKETTLNRLKSVATFLQDCDITRLKVAPNQLHYDKDVRATANVLPWYLEAFRQLRGVREPIVTLFPDPFKKWEKAKRRLIVLPDETRAMERWTQQWRNYYEEWTADLKRARIEETACRDFDPDCRQMPDCSESVDPNDLIPATVEMHSGV